MRVTESDFYQSRLRVVVDPAGCCALHHHRWQPAHLIEMMRRRGLRAGSCSVVGACTACGTSSIRFLQERRSKIEPDDRLRVYDPAVVRVNLLATSRRVVLTVVGAVVAGIGVQLLLPLGHKPIKDLALGVVLLALGTPLMVFSLETLGRERGSRECSLVEEALRRGRSESTADEQPPPLG